ncbi:MAG: co-chaperone GroES [Patescibacteria group bacterium]
MPNKVSKKLNLIPSAGYVLIAPFEAQTKTDSGIFLPDTANPEKPQKGKVIEVGEALTTDFGIKKGSPVNKDEIAYYKKWGGNEVKVDGKEYLFVKFEDILAIER